MITSYGLSAYGIPSATEDVVIAATTHDLTIRERYPGAPYVDMLATGHEQDTVPNQFWLRCLLYFNFSSISISVESATLNLYHKSMMGTAFTLEIYRITETWSFNVSAPATYWNHQPSKDNTIIQSFIPTGSGWTNVEITDLVKAWTNGTYLNYGIYLWGNNAASTGNNFYEFEGFGEANPPYIELSDVVPEFKNNGLIFFILLGFVAVITLLKSKRSKE